MSQPKVRVRFAPSPTGYLHVGGARTALYNYLYAKQQGGDFVLRIEDTDEERSTESSLRMQIQDLVWLGFNWDEGPDAESLKDIGDKGPYRQSQRKDIYKGYAEQLIDKGVAYYCFMTEDEIEAQKKQLEAQGKPPHLQSPYRDWDKAKAQAKLAEGTPAVVRFKVPKVKTDFTFTDLVRGEVTFPSDMIGDFVLVRAGGMPVYNFSCTVDDALMEITHVFRAEEHLSNTLRQMMIYQALDWKLPQFGHLSIILGEDRQKLSKRHGATSCNEYRLKGYLPEALNNFIALLGWSSAGGEEIMSMEQMIMAFDTSRLNPAAAVFDETKLKWVNAMHLRNLNHDELWKRITPFLEEAGLELPKDPEWQDQSLQLFKTSMETLVDAVELYRPISDKNFEINDEGKDTLSWDTSRSVIETWMKLVEEAGKDYLTEAEFSAIQDKIKNDCAVKGKQLFMPIRVAVIGKPHGAELKVLVPLLKTSSLIRRALSALELC